MLCAMFGRNCPSGSGEKLFEQLESPLRKEHCAKFGWNWLSGSGEEDENVTSLQVDRQTTGDQKNSLEFSAQMS